MTPIKTTSDLLRRLKELLPHNTLFGRTDDLPKDFKEGFVVHVGDINKIDEKSGICGCNNYDQIIFIDYRLQSHRDDWLFRTTEKQEELLLLLQEIHPRLRFENFDEPQAESAEFTFVGSRSTWAFNYDL